MSADNISMNFKELQELDQTCMKHDPFYLENNPNTVLVAAKMSVLRMTDRIAELDARCAKLEAALQFYASEETQYGEPAREALTTNVDERGES